MAIVPTGAIYKSLVFDGESSRDYGIYITGQAVYNAPERDVEMINIPGRNGSFALDKGRFQNIEVTYPAGIFADNETDFAQGISDFRNFLCSRNGYVRLTDDYNPDEYRMAVYKSGLDVSPAQLRAGEFKIVFDCKPQRYLTSGEEPITIGEWHETETASGSIASFEAVDGDAVKSLVADINPIQDLNGYDKPWSGGAGRNKYAVQIGRDTFLDRNSATHTRNNDVLTINATSTKNSGVVTASSATLQQLTASLSGTYTYSFDIKASVEGFIDIGFASAGSMSLGVVTGWHRVSITSSDFNATEKTFEVRNGGDGSARTIEIRNFMIQEGSTATDYEPYSNICPISGYDSVVVSRCGKNFLNPTLASSTSAGITATKNSDNSYTLSGTATGIAVNVWIQGNYLTDVNQLPQYRLKFFKKGTVITFKDCKLFFYNNETGALNQTYGLSSVPIGSSARTLTLPYDSWLTGVRVPDGVVGESYDGVTIYPQLELGTTATAYEPYQGNTYTINLNGTRYGGTLDVASGVLTVTKGYVDLGTLNWSYISSASVFYADIQGGPLPVNGGNDGLCSIYSIFKGPYPAMTDKAVTIANKNFSSAQGRTAVKDTSYSSASAFKTAMNGVQLVYPLATPQTVQLTAQEVELLVGLNQVWANSGDVEVEYGTRPSAVYNPTLFESSPMLEVTGYGEIGVGDDAIVVNDTAIGDIYISEGGTITRRDNELSITLPITFETRDLNGGDKFYISDATATIQSTVKSGYTTDGCSASSFDTAATTNATGTSKAMRIKYSMIFIYNEGTLPAQSDSNSATFFDRWTHGGTAGSNNAIFTISGSYTGGNTLTLTLTIQLSECFDSLTVKSLTLPRVRAKSTKSALGTPTYIDLDIGEAWNTDSGEPVSANNAVIFPSTLPTLKPGVTEFNLPGSVTDLKVIPRWWKI